MRIALRADSSPVQGTGHVMRQVSIAQYLLRQGHDVFFVGSLDGPEWLRAYVKSIARLQLVAVKEGQFELPLLAELSIDVVLIDSYLLSQRDLDALQDLGARVAVMLDGPWQRLSGSVAFAPAFELNSEWLRTATKRFTHFYSGPAYFPLREEVVEIAQRRPNWNRAPLPPPVVVSLGGAASKLEARVVSILLNLSVQVKLEIFFQPDFKLRRKIAASRHEVTVHPKGGDFLERVAHSRVTISALGSVAAELLYLGVPTVFVQAASNQSRNARAVANLRLGPVLQPTAYSFSRDLESSVGMLLREAAIEKNQTIEIDSRGAQRIGEALLL